MSGKIVRASATREAILVTAERLYAEHGVHTVSNRQISDAAGQGNNTAVGYHFGTKTDLVRAIVGKHAAPMERLRADLLARAEGSGEIRDWVACLVRPSTAHLDELGSPTWYARFIAQVTTDPALRKILVEESMTSQVLIRVVEGLNRCLPALPAPIRVERGEMSRHLMIHVPAERERALAEGTPTPRATWQDAADGLIDAIAGIWTAPVSG
ncbi:TetR/AcrR family transcriptional regulator [Amycolatopsis panacis]|uniref:TetR/AcrR family transcriptional regulator n=1 Tax=Amycolatopsis panacis TaxID=2340917 RepID=A0A419HR10_9PSEU|nr:TetR/AcrR family transcriptional regulator [Amycolatopsis panacis]RJQ78913.1 TetR/AcrR family transcriptional regulator [Amycolatopsis panacis]